MSNVNFDCITNSNLCHIGEGLFAIAKAIDRLTEVLKPVEITCENKLVIEEESNNASN